MYEEEKDQYPKAPELDRSCRALSSRWSDEGSQEGSQQKGMPRKGARMKVGDLVMYKFNPGVMAIVVDMHPQSHGRPYPDLLQVSGQEWFIIKRGINPMLTTDAFTVAKDGDRQAYIEPWANSQIS